jgi:hypothetical protein
MEMANTLECYDTAIIITVKSFIVWAPDGATTLSLTTLSIKGLHVTLSISDTQRKLNSA